jgi:hypothetical protein
MLKLFTGSQPAKLMQAIERDDADALAKLLRKATPQRCQQDYQIRQQFLGA